MIANFSIIWSNLRHVANLPFDGPPNEDINYFLYCGSGLLPCFILLHCQMSILCNLVLHIRPTKNDQIGYYLDFFKRKVGFHLMRFS